MSSYETFFSGKRVTQMGLGLLGRGINDAKFLAEHVAELTITDLKSEDELQSALRELASFSSISYTLGKHVMKDFENRDFILKAAGVPLDSPYIHHARERGISIEMDESLFVKLAPSTITTIGVTGTRGKTTTTFLIHHLLKAANVPAHVSGNIPGVATLPLLEQISDQDVLVLELSSWQLQGFDEARMSPHIAVFTNFMPDHLNYYHGDLDRYFTDKAAIYRYQNDQDIIIVGPAVADRVAADQPPGNILIAPPLPESWNLSLRGTHNRENAACAVAVARHLGIADEVIRHALESFTDVPGRLAFVGEYNGVSIYNDNNATTPDATRVALETFGPKEVVLIMGGTDKGLSFDTLFPEVERACKGVVLLDESGSQRIKDRLAEIDDLELTMCDTMHECVRAAREQAVTGDVILFSPAFASFGKHFINEYDREQQFLESIEKL